MKKRSFTVSTVIASIVDTTIKESIRMGG